MNDLKSTNSETLFDADFGKEMIKSVALSTAATVGVLAGFLLVGQAIVTVKDFRDKRAAKKAAKES